MENQAGTAPPAGVAAPKVVLVVDDEPASRVSLQVMLEETMARVEVIAVASGPLALATLRARPVDLIIADYMMPGMDGLEFLVEAKQLAPSVPRIMVTGHADVELAMQAINDAQVANFFTKPLEGKTVGVVIQGILYEQHVARRGPPI